jgi:DNA ligase-1
MPDLADGEAVEVQGSGSNRYELKNTGGIYSCSCPAWRNQGHAIEKRTCKHLKAYRGEQVELDRVGLVEPIRREKAASASGGAAAKDDGPPLLLAHSFELTQDPTGWWMSEKLDGVRAYWDGQRFVSRLGNFFHPPDWFVKGYPSIPLDGELFGGRKKFQRTVGLVKRQDKSDLWKELAYVVFDAPAVEGPFEKRMEECKAHVKGEYARVHEHVRCEGIDHLKVELARVEGLGGEGLMLRKPGSRYEVGRSSTLLKVKTFHDAEAKVVGHVAGAGRHKGRLGALMVTMPDGTKFKVGTGFSDEERRNPPAVGVIITYRYQELSDGGVPRFPSYVGVRADAEFESQPPLKKKPPALASPATAAPASPAPAAPAAAPTAPPPAPMPAGPPGAKRHFELVEGSSSKFWEVWVTGSEQRVRFGKIGSQGQTKVKTFGSEESAHADSEKLISEKTKKGYVEK